MIRRSLVRFVFVTCAVLACGGGSRSNSPGPSPRSLAPDEEAAVIATATRLFDSAAGDVPVCLELVDAGERYEVNARVLRALGPRARQMKGCPPTYTTMIVTPETAKRPPGYIDPYHLEFRWPRLTAEGFSVTAQLWQGTGFAEYRCTVQKDAVDRPASCVVTRQGVS